MNRDDLIEEHRRIVDGAGWKVLDGWNTVRVTGADRVAFLHNMCTNDIRGLSSGDCVEAFFTDVKGKTIAHAFVLTQPQAIELLMTPHTAERLIGHLDRYIVREDVVLQDVSSEVAWMAVVGRNASQYAQLRAKPVSQADLAPGSGDQMGDGGLEDVQLFVFRAPWCGGALLRIPTSELAAVVAAYQQPDHPELVRVSDEAWHAIRIESGWPLWSVDFDAANLPQEVNRDAAAIHFRKGCYLGQETVARIDALGHVNKKLVNVCFAGNQVPLVGAELMQGDRAAGRITSACWSPRRQSPLALAMVQRGFNDAGAELHWAGGSCIVLSLQNPTA